MTDLESTFRVGDEAYWAQYYKSGAAPEEPSRFAKYVADNYATKGQKVIELGCGNGRDARYLASLGLGVVAVDLCASEVDRLSGSNNNRNLRYEQGDFTNLPDSEDAYDIVYSRFTLHSVNYEGQSRALDWSYRNLASLGKLCIETRGQMNELYGKGEPVEGEPDAFIYEDHYRRFVAFEDLKSDISSVGFNIVESAEQTGFAPFEDTDYHFIRIIAEKP